MEVSILYEAAILHVDYYGSEKVMPTALGGILWQTGTKRLSRGGILVRTVQRGGQGGNGGLICLLIPIA